MGPHVTANTAMGSHRGTAPQRRSHQTPTTKHHSPIQPPTSTAPMHPDPRLLITDYGSLITNYRPPPPLPTKLDVARRAQPARNGSVHSPELVSQICRFPGE